MFTINREKGPWPSPSAVDEMLRRVEDFDHEADDYIWRIRTYLNYAKECNLGSRAVVVEDSGIKGRSLLTGFFDAGAGDDLVAGVCEHRLQ